MTILPRDSYGDAIPAVRPIDGKAHAITSSGTHNENTVAFDENTQVLLLYATEDVYIKFGTDDTVEATDEDHFFPAGVYYGFSLNDRRRDFNYTYISVLQVSTGGTLYISECE